MIEAIKISKNVIILAVALPAVAWVSACHHVEGEQTGINAKHGLSGFSNCNEFESYAKRAAEEMMLAEIEALKDSMKQTHETMGAGSAPVANESDGDTGSSDSGGGDFSQTNVQEDGVDEPDLVKNDGEYLYVLHAGELVIIEASAQGNLAHAGRAEVGGYAKELFIRGDLAAVFSTLSAEDVPNELELPTGPGDTSPDCWDWGECGSWGAGYTQIALVDITDRSQPSVLRTIILAGRYNTARLIDNKLKLVVHTDIPTLHMSWGSVDDSWMWDSDNFIELGLSFHELYESNMSYLSELTLDDILPRKLDSVDGAVTALADCRDILGPQTPAGIGLTSVVSLDLDSPGNPISTASVFGDDGLVYATTSSLYLTTSREYVQMVSTFGLWKRETSGVHKFDISSDSATAKYLATGVVEGRMLNQFCLGEYEGFLRVATTTGISWEPDSLDNHLTVLTERNGELKVVSQLDGIGTGEEIYAARFLGNRGFMVTFYQTDPLFTLDLSDPANPVVVGEWLGPGYSTYLHPVGADQVLAVGMEDWTVALSLYDVSNLADPSLIERLYLDESYYCAAVYDHKAFTFNEETGMLALPYYGGDWNTGIYLYDVTSEGIDHTGTVQVSGHEDGVGATLRSAYIDNAIFGITRCRVASAMLDQPENSVDSVELYTAASCDDFGSQGEWGWEM